MKSRRSMLVAAGLAVLVLAFCAAAVLLFRGIGQFSSAGRRADELFRQLGARYGRVPFASADNVEQTGRDTERVAEWTRGLVAALEAGEPSAGERSPTLFMSQLGRTRNALLERARERGVTIAPGFGFGFDPYFKPGSSLPLPDVVSELSRQLAAVDHISRVLFDAGIAALDTVSVEDLQALAAAQAATGAPPPAPAAATNLFDRRALTVVFHAPERAAFAALNALTRPGGTFVAVRGVRLEREQPDVDEGERERLLAAETALRRGVESAPAGSVAAGTAPAATPAGPPPPRDKRTVAGPGVEKPMRVTLDLEMYRFRGHEGGGA